MQKNRQTKSVNISNPRWLAYATAGAATALGSATSAEAEIHYSGLINVRFEWLVDQVMQFPLDHRPKLIFLAGYGYYYHGRNYYPAGAFFGIRGAAVSNSFCGHHGEIFRSLLYVSQVAPGKPVSQGNFVGWGPQPLQILGTDYGRGDWGAGARKEGFIGFRFDNGNGMQYGWARLKLLHPDAGAYYGFNLVDYAWGDPGDVVLTGQTSSAGEMVDNVTESGSVGLLALGAAGLLAWRKRRGQATH